MQQVCGNPNDGSLGDSDAVDLDSFFAHPLQPRSGGMQTHGLQNNQVQVLQVIQGVIWDGGLRIDQSDRQQPDY